MSAMRIGEHMPFDHVEDGGPMMIVGGIEMATLKEEGERQGHIEEFRHLGGTAIMPNLEAPPETSSKDGREAIYLEEQFGLYRYPKIA